MPPYPRLTEVKIQGYRPFRNFTARLSPLEIMVGANGAGKSSLFEFLKFLRDSIYAEIPPEIIPGSIGQQIFHIPGPEANISVIGDFTVRSTLPTRRFANLFLLNKNP